MPRVDNHQLVNMSLGEKILATLGLLFGLFLFFSAILFSVFITSWDTSLGAVVHWGQMLVRLRAEGVPWFYALFAAHAFSLLLIVLVANALFHRVAIPRGARVALMGVTTGFALLDVLCWALLSVLGFADTALGAVVLLECVSLAYLIGRPLRDMWIYARLREPPGRKVRVVIVGGGFAGLYAAIGLDKLVGYHRDIEITVLDRRNYFLFPPLLPSVATGAIETRQVTYPFRRLFEATNIVFKKEHVEGIDLARRVIQSRVDVGEDPRTKELKAVYVERPFDYLVLAPGSATNTFGTTGVTEHAFFMREIGDAMAVRNHIIDCFEHAAREESPERRRELLSFVVVGAGPTGVELASEINDLIHHVLLRRYPELGRDEIKVRVIQSGKQILPGWHEHVVSQASAQLAAIGIELLLDRRVTGVGATSVTMKGGEVIRTRTCVWCAGVKPAPLLAKTGLPLHASGRVEVGPDCRVPSHPNVFVLGDAAFLTDKGRALPPLGQVAFQQGSHAAKNILRMLRSKPTLPFKYFNYGALVSVGEHFAAVDLMGVRLSGFVAWLIWRTLYLTKLVGFSNKVRVLLDWTLDLLVERSISQISVTRQELREEIAEINDEPTVVRTQ
jgi:NADH:ubiquinone reductase (H+-translocating)